MRGDLQVNIMFTKITNNDRTDIPYENITEKEKEERGIDFGKRFYGSFGYDVKEKAV